MKPLHAVLASLVLAGLGLSGASRALRAQGDPTSQACVRCHLTLSDTALSAPARSFPSDIHAEKGLGCLDCHGRATAGGSLDPEMGFLRRPARRDIPALCGRCHSDADYMHRYDPSLRVDQVTEYWTSDHGKRLRDLDDPDVATCVDCHQVHRIRPPTDPEAATYPLNVPETCGRCHADAARMSRHGLPSDQLEKFRTSVHGKLIFEDGDLSAPVCNDCHGNHGAQPPGVSSVRYVCGQCHGVMGEYFDGNGHKDAFESADLPGCATCHGHHAIQKTSDANLEERAQQVCATCHSGEDPRGREFQGMAHLLDSLTTQAAASRELLLRARDEGMEVSQALFELDDVNNALTKARSAIHSFRQAPVKKEVDAGLALTSAGMARGVAALAEHRTRRVGLGISSGIILLLITGILLKIRDREERADAALTACRAFFEEELRDARPSPAGDELRLAAVAVLLEGLRGRPRPERLHAQELVRRGFGLPPGPADALVTLVEHAEAEPVAGGCLSRMLGRTYTAKQLQGVMEELWFLVYSDPDLAALEVHLFEVLPGLLHVDRHQVALARRSAGAPLTGKPKGDGNPW